MTALRSSVLLFFVVGCGTSIGAADETFEKVRRVFERHCVSCHNDNDVKGGLSLTTGEGLAKGGDSGASIVAGKPDESELLQQITGSEPAMPKDRPALAKEEVEAVQKWIEAGGHWPEKTVLRDRRFDPSEWWSFQPLRPIVPPAVAGPVAAEIRNPIDRFVLAALAERNLSPSPEADRRTLIRRVTFDLTGLPPTPEEIATFLGDTQPLAYERLVDRLLASPHYGERWARHWLDVVHFGETHGYDKDKTRENAWPYRDYVIRAFNEDRPYGRFIREQLAGDVLYPLERDGLEGPGFIAAGPWDFIGHAEVPESKTDGKIARHLDRDDMITNTIQTFCSLTVQCAQCHDHKFDPILQEDYYSLQAVFAAVDRTDRKYDLDPAVAIQRQTLEQERTHLVAERGAIEQRIAAKVGPRWQELSQQITAAEIAPAGQHPLEAQYGWHSGIASLQEEPKWVQVELPAATEIAQVTIHPCRDDFNNIGEGFGFPVRYKVEVSSDPVFEKDVRMVADQTGADVPNPKIQPQRWMVGGPAARYVRVTATKLAPRLNDFIFSLAELDVVGAAGQNLARGEGVVVTSADSIEAAPRWRRTNLVDGYYPGVTEQAPQLADLRVERDRLRAAATTEADRTAVERLDTRLNEIGQKLATLPKQATSYVAKVHTGSGTFVGTGAEGGRPRPIHVLKRGSVLSPAAEVGPGGIAFVSGLAGIDGRFAVPAEAGEGGRRAALAGWITSDNHPLTWRSIVNRVWHYHFGRGLVETPNDFGRNGALPTHPQLLDWLARHFRDGGGSIKDLQRLIVTSRTYRQMSQDRPENAATDADNRWLWRMNRRRLDAESVRDTVLMVSGKLGAGLYGPSFRDFVIEKPEHSPHYEYHLFDPNDANSHRRSVYRFIVRSQPQPFMTTLDCADPSMQVDRRNESLSPLQALALLNNDLMLAMSEHFAGRLTREHTGLESQIEAAVLLATGHPATEEQRTLLSTYAREHGLRNACRVLFNLNEFLFVE